MMYLIEKRGYYFRPDASGYTAYKEEAGRYSEQDVKDYCDNPDCIAIPEEDATMFSSSADATDQMRYWKNKYEQLEKQTEQKWLNFGTGEWFCQPIINSEGIILAYIENKYGVGGTPGTVASLEVQRQIYNGKTATEIKSVSELPKDAVILCFRTGEAILNHLEVMDSLITAAYGEEDV